MSDHSTTAELPLTSGATAVNGRRRRERPASVPAGGAGALSDRWFGAALGLIALGAGALWLTSLSTSSLFTDEALSWREAASGLSSLMTLVRHAELNPPGYPLFLHGWIKIAPTSEWWLRLPSVLAGVAAVGAVAWVTALVAGRRAALLAALLAAASPYYFQDAQEVRSYIFVMLAVTVAVAGALQAEEGRANRWLWVSFAAAAVAQWVHYTAWLVLVPLGIYVLLSGRISLRAKALWTAGVAASGLVWAPLLADQWRAGHNGWLTRYGNLAWAHFGDVFGAPFSGRVATPPPRSVLGAGVVLAAALVTVVSRRAGRDRLLVALALVPAGALLLATLSGHPALEPRYAAVGVPFMVAMIAIAIRKLPTGTRSLAFLGVLALAILNVVQAELPHGQYRDTRSSLEYVASDYHGGDLVAVIGPAWTVYPIEYYSRRLLPAGVTVTFLRPGNSAHSLSYPTIKDALAAHRTIWWVNYDEPFSANPRPPGYRQTTKRLFPAIGWIEVTRVAPR